MSHTITKLTYSDYVCYPDDGNRHEIIDGDHYMNPAPSTYHQTVSRRIHFSLYEQIELTGLGVVYNAPVDLHVGDHDIVQPDIVAVLKENEQIITPSKIKGVPDLVIEILSPSSIKNDKELKRSLYQRIGVPEYWIVDPFEHEVTQLVLNSGQYKPIKHDQVVTVSISPGVSVDLQKVW